MELKKLYLNRPKMKHFIRIIFGSIFFLGFVESKAETLIDSLSSAYLNNPKLNAERASMRASKEEKREAVSEFLPKVYIDTFIAVSIYFTVFMIALKFLLVLLKPGSNAESSEEENL